MKLEIPQRCPCCHELANRDNVRTLFRYGDRLFWCIICNSYSFRHPKTNNAWYCSKFINVIEAMVKEDHNEKA